MAKKAKKKTRATKKAATASAKPPKTNGAIAASGKVERARYQESHPCRIEAELVAKKADEFAAAYRRREAILEERRTAMADFRETLSGIDDTMKQLSISVEKHTEERDVEVVEYLIVATSEIQCVRTDTGEIVEKRTASAEDRQETLFDGSDVGELVDCDECGSRVRKEVCVTVLDAPFCPDCVKGAQRDAGNAKESARSKRRSQIKPGEEITAPADILAADANGEG